MTKYSLGIDFGTSSVRALLVNLETGDEAGHAEHAYELGHGGVLEDPSDPNLARQHPNEWLVGMAAVVPAVLRASGAAPAEVVGIGVDTTGSTPLPVDRRLRPLCQDPRFAERPEAWAWLWKDHTAHAEAKLVTELAQATRPHFLKRCGGIYSSEWYWAKALRCAKVAPDVFAAAYGWVECCDFVTAWLCGEEDPSKIRRSVCAAGHKAMSAPEWGGMPDEAFLRELAPELAELRRRLSPHEAPSDQVAGRLAEAAAQQLGLQAGTKVAVGAFDAHLGAVGAGIAVGDLVKVIGTSSCDMAIGSKAGGIPDVSGISGIVADSIVPGYLGFEAGQSAVGDIYGWCAEQLGHNDHRTLTREATKLRPGASGLLALDWHNGNRCVLTDPELSGALLGLNLQTRPAEIYRAMIEATAFGAKMIVDRLVEKGIPIRRVIACGGIAQKSPLVMQVHADVLGVPIAVAASSETCALGAAIMAACAAGEFADVATAQRALVRPSNLVFSPDPAAVALYVRLFALYRLLHDAFGGVAPASQLGGVMKELLRLRASRLT